MNSEAWTATNRATDTTQSQRRPLLGPLGKVLVGSLVAYALVMLYWQAVVADGLFPPIGITAAVGSLIVAGVVAARRLWASVVAVACCALQLGLELPPTFYILGSPDITANWVVLLLEMVLLLSGIVTGIGLTLQHYRSLTTGPQASM